VIADSGALHEVEQLITRRGDEALQTLQSPLIDEAARSALQALAVAALQRNG
jgi:hypothetical protein